MIVLMGFYGNALFGLSQLNVPVTGCQTDAFIVFMEKYIKKMAPKIIFIKEKHILATIFGIDLLSKEPKKNYLYRFDETKPMMKITEINSSSNKKKI